MHKMRKLEYADIQCFMVNTLKNNMKKLNRYTQNS